MCPVRFGVGVQRCRTILGHLLGHLETEHTFMFGV
jgi:hypothetical protein